VNIIQCSICKKPFQSFGGRICGNCLEKIDKDFITVRDYIYENKHADIDTVAEETGVQRQIIIHLLKEGRLIIEDPEGGGSVLFCEVCKKPINTGRMCNACKEKVSMTMQKNVVSPKSGDQQKRDAQQSIKTAKLKQ